jgi:hypothetical protein
MTDPSCNVVRMTTTGTATRYATTHVTTGEPMDVAHAKRAGVRWQTWAKFSAGWSPVGVSTVADYPGAVKAARSAAPYATDWDATPATAK